MATFPRGVPAGERVVESKQTRARPVVVVEDEPQFASKLPGDTDALRGFPMIGRGVAGAIPGTSPGSGGRVSSDGRGYDSAAANQPEACRL